MHRRPHAINQRAPSTGDCEKGGREWARSQMGVRRWLPPSTCRVLPYMPAICVGRLVSGHTNYFVDKRINSYDTRSVASRSLSKEPAPPPLPTGAEIAILAVLWRQGASTVREVHEALAKDSGYTTTLKLMQLMFEKGLVVRNERYRSHLYEARAPKEQTQRQMAGDLLKRAFEGSTKSLLLGALAAQPASGKDLADIRSLLDEFEKRKGKK